MAGSTPSATPTSTALPAGSPWPTHCRHRRHRFAQRAGLAATTSMATTTWPMCPARRTVGAWPSTHRATQSTTAAALGTRRCWSTPVAPTTPTSGSASSTRCRAPRPTSAWRSATSMATASTTAPAGRPFSGRRLASGTASTPCRARPRRSATPRWTTLATRPSGTAGPGPKRPKTRASTSASARGPPTCPAHPRRPQSTASTSTTTTTMRYMTMGPGWTGAPSFSPPATSRPRCPATRSTGAAP